MNVSWFGPTRIDCPDEESLKAFALGKLSEIEIEKVGVHLKCCERCRRLLNVLEPSDDSLIAYLKRTKCATIEDQEIRDLAARLADMHNAISESRAWQDASPHEREPGLCNYAAVPDRLGQYRLVEVIGRGSMGTVYRAWHSKLKRVVAVKVLSPKRLDDYRAVARFSREMEAIGKLDDHPNIVRARDAGEIDGHHFLVMDFVDGLDAGLLVFRLGRLSVADACETTRQAALGLDYAHRRGIVHRDVKPSNLLVGRTGVAKVLDLGLAAFGVASRDGRAVVGTADYMAPEQWTGSVEADHRADIYSLGCTLYKLLVGWAPFNDPSDSRRDKMKAHLKAPVPLVSEVLPMAAGDLDAVVRRMLAKKPANRFQRASDVAAALEPLALGSDLAALVRQATSAEADTDRPRSEVTLVERRTVADDTYKWGASWRKAAVGVLGAALLLAAVFWALFSGQAARVGPQALLLERPDEVRWRYDVQKDALNLDTKGIALFRHGSTESRTYTIHTTMIQKDWQGGAGMFFGYKEERSGDRQSFHTVGVRRMAGGARGGTHEIVWSVVNVERSVAGVETTRWRDQHAVPLTINKGALRHLLDVTVVDGQLKRVMWDGEELMRINDEAEDARSSMHPLGEDFGVFGASGVTIFEETYLEED